MFHFRYHDTNQACDFSVCIMETEFSIFTLSQNELAVLETQEREKRKLRKTAKRKAC